MALQDIFYLVAIVLMSVGVVTLVFFVWVLTRLLTGFQALREEIIFEIETAMDKLTEPGKTGRFWPVVLGLGARIFWLRWKRKRRPF